MNRTLFYFDKSSIAKACEQVKKFCKDGLLEAPNCNVYQIPGDIDSKKSALFVDSNKSVFVDYINRIIRAYDWRADGIEGFEEAKSSAPEDAKTDSPDESYRVPFVYFSCKTGTDADLISSTAHHDFREAVVAGKLSIEKTISQKDNSKTYIRARSMEQKYRDSFNTFVNNFDWASYSIEKPEMHVGQPCEERNVEIRIVDLTKAREEELESFGLRQVDSNPESIFELDKKVREELLRRQEESLSRIKPSKFEAVKAPADFCRGTADVSLTFALRAEQAGLVSNNMYEVLENAKQIYDFLLGTSSHFIDGKSLGGEKNAR